MSEHHGKLLAITGGVGGAKLALGLTRICSDQAISFLVNTGDDFRHMGLHISPDIDTLTYTLAGLSNPETGWGREGETWHFIEALRQLGGEGWFNLGDRDLATHVLRSHWLAQGMSLTAVTAEICRRLNVSYALLPMSNDPVQTLVRTASGTLSFQHYFVRERCEPAVVGFEFNGSDTAKVSAELDAALTDPMLEGVIICPSNPFVSIDPIFAVGDMRERISALSVPVVAISPIVGGEAIKGPTAKMMSELGIQSSALTVARHYSDLLDGYIIDEADKHLSDDVEALGFATTVAQTVMVTLADRIELAQTAVDMLRRIKNGK